MHDEAFADYMADHLDFAIYYRTHFDPEALREVGWPSEVFEVGGWGGGESSEAGSASNHSCFIWSAFLRTSSSPNSP